MYYSKCTAEHRKLIFLSFLINNRDLDSGPCRQSMFTVCRWTAGFFKMRILYRGVLLYLLPECCKRWPAVESLDVGCYNRAGLSNILQMLYISNILFQNRKYSFYNIKKFIMILIQKRYCLYCTTVYIIFFHFFNS